jgi:hypothetical protein
MYVLQYNNVHYIRINHNDNEPQKTAYLFYEHPASATKLEDYPLPAISGCLFTSRCLYNASLKTHHTLSRQPYRRKLLCVRRSSQYCVLVLIVCWKQTPVIFYWWRNDLHLCLMMMPTQICFRHSISGGHLVYPEPKEVARRHDKRSFYMSKPFQGTLW